MWFWIIPFINGYSLCVHVCMYLLNFERIYDCIPSNKWIIKHTANVETVRHWHKYWHKKHIYYKHRNNLAVRQFGTKCYWQKSAKLFALTISGKSTICTSLYQILSFYLNPQHDVDILPILWMMPKVFCMTCIFR